jgi:hypothetical protein
LLIFERLIYFEFKSMKKMRLSIIGILVLIMFSVASAVAQDESKPSADKSQTGEDLRAKTQNPVGAMYSLPFKFSADFGAENGTAYFLNIQPVIPVTIGDWNLINRVIAPLVSVDGFIEGVPEIPEGDDGDRVTGVGDINYSLFLSPAKPSKIIWGIGPSINLPTATDDQLGSGKWSAGPTAVILTQPKPWTLGVLARQLWSFAGDSDRSDVKQFLLEPFINYNLSRGWYLISDMIITANWDAKPDRRWTVPIGGGFGKMFKIGNQAMNSKLEAYYNVEKPDGAPDWSASFTIQLLFPK